MKSDNEIDRRARAEHKRRQAKPWRKWYNLPRWQARRARQLTEHPTCERCAKRGILVPATVANHVTPHRGNRRLFDLGRLESVCKPCHDGDIQAEERNGFSRTIGLDGFPVSPSHPFNRPA